MLKGIPKVISPELLSVLMEMGHSDRIVVADGNFPGARMAAEGGALLVRADGIGAVELLDAILSLMPLDEYTDKPALIMEKEARDAELKCPIWEEFKSILGNHEVKGGELLGSISREDFYDEAREAYCIVQTGESAVYANIMLQKGVIK